MSLLTEEQIAELACIASNQSTSKDLYQEFCKWNEKQDDLCGFLQCYEPKWLDLYKNVKKMDIKVNFYGDNENILETLIVSHHRPEPVITPHPHAEMIMKYAEVAQRRVDPWVEFQITFDEDDDCWSSCVDELRFLVNGGRRYRHIGETK
jgi:hypothetical protein